ncbi:Uncharacterised protein [Mycobacteroides abscessus subsp. massiliense]|nr:Uncharacterised protein [Mycobacteroides abscessus subsp. massiliense]
MWQINITSYNSTGTCFFQSQLNLITTVKLEYDTFNVQENVNNILLNTINSRVFVQYAGNNYFSWGKAIHG